MIVKPCILTVSGRLVNPLNVQPHDIDIEDMASGLSKINRFCGSSIVPLNVAQHSVFVSFIAQKLTPDPSKRAMAGLQGLLHDGSEYILGDVTKWLKRTPEMAAYRDAEDRAQRVIYEVFGCPYELFDAVQMADDLMVRREAQHTWGPEWSQVPGYGPLSAEEFELIGHWVPWSWEASKSLFLEHYRLLKAR